MTEQTIHCRKLLSGEGWLSDRVVRVDSDGMILGMDAPGEQTADHVLDVVIPGMPNLHSHAFQRAMAGLGGFSTSREDSFWTWRDEMYRLANRISPGQMEAVAAWLQVEMLKGGYTSCAEFHYLHHGPDGSPYDDPAEMSGRVFAAGDRSGLAVTLLPVLYCRAGFEQEDVNENQRRFAHSPTSFLQLFESCEQLARTHPNRGLGLAIHSLRAVSPGQMREVMDAIGGRACAIHLHVAEQPAEVQDCLNHLSNRPLAYLLDHFDVNDRWCLVHATHLDEHEICIGAASGAVAGLCPVTEADLGDGLFHLEQWLDAGGRFGIGSDSNLRLSAAEELRLLEHGARLSSNKRNRLARNGLGCGRFGWQQAASAGASALGQAIGRIEAGRRADLVEIDSGHPLLVGLEEDEILNAFIFAADREAIRSVWVAGRAVVREGGHLHETEIRHDYVQAMEELRQ